MGLIVPRVREMHTGQANSASLAIYRNRSKPRRLLRMVGQFWTADGLAPLSGSTLGPQMFLPLAVGRPPLPPTPF